MQARTYALDAGHWAEEAIRLYVDMNMLIIHVNSDLIVLFIVVTTFPKIIGKCF